LTHLNRETQEVEACLRGVNNMGLGLVEAAPGEARVAAAASDTASLRNQSMTISLLMIRAHQLSRLEKAWLTCLKGLGKGGEIGVKFV
jgi:hypothetical protein